MPISAFPIRDAYWVWVILSFISAALAALIAGRALVPRSAIPLVALMLTFEPLWHLVWWGQVDALILLPVATGLAWLIRSRTDREDLVAGVLIGFLALIPQYAILPFLTLAVARRRAALGMALTGAVLASVTMAVIRLDGLRGYIEFYRSYGRLGNNSTVSEHAMFNIRGMVFRIDERLTGIDLSLAAFGWSSCLRRGAGGGDRLRGGPGDGARPGTRPGDRDAGERDESSRLPHAPAGRSVFFVIPMGGRARPRLEPAVVGGPALACPGRRFHAETAILRSSHPSATTRSRPTSRRGASCRARPRCPLSSERRGAPARSRSRRGRPAENVLVIVGRMPVSARRRPGSAPRSVHEAAAALYAAS
jgi:hypothetical protein